MTPPNRRGADDRNATVGTALVELATLSSSGTSTRLNATEVRAHNKNIHNPYRFFDAAGQLDPNQFTPKEFEDFLLAKQGELKTVTLSGYRSAIKDLYRRHNMTVPPEFGEPLKTRFSGLKRMEADHDQSGINLRKSGKQQLNYTLYSTLCRETMSRNDSGFTHLFLTTQWNLMCQSKSVETSSTTHLVNADDSIGCILHKTKTNQEGSGPKDPRHLYANPLSPDTCWVTALAIYLACNPRLKPGPLFPGSSQKIRFSKALSATIGKQGEAKQYGTHSIKKGVASFACGGSTVGPPIVSVCLRCGHLEECKIDIFGMKVQLNQYLGRVVAGLPVNKSVFAVLPPHFGDQLDPTVLERMEQMFPSLMSESNLSEILKLCMASLVYHADHIRSRLPTTHSLFGIPPHIELYKQQEDTNKAVNDLPAILFDGFSKLLEEKGVAAGHITKSVLENTIRQLLAKTVLRGHGNLPCEDEATNSPQQSLYFWNNKFLYLPENFEFPSIYPLTAWKLWWFGNASLHYPPLRNISTIDLSTKRKASTFSEWSIFMKYLTQAIEEETGLPIPKQMSETQA
ncbi:LOW QUALITY PROTEIN: hypothetical protein PHMEG_00031781, partial [Phytophthora megakarya]